MIKVNTDLIRARRLQLGLTMQECAERAGLASRTRWNQIENGRALDPQVSTMYRIATALEVTIDELMLPPRRSAGKAQRN